MLNMLHAKLGGHASYFSDLSELDVCINFYKFILISLVQAEQKH